MFEHWAKANVKIQSVDVFSLIGGIVLATVVSAIASVVTVGIQRRLMGDQAEINSREERQKFERNLRVEHLKSQIANLYGPLAILLAVNATLFRKTYGTDAWETARKDVLLPNNEKIAKFIINHSHLVDGADMSSIFVDFLIHQFVWRGYQEVPGGLPPEYLDKKVNFPEGFEEHVIEKLRFLRNEYLDMINARK